MNHGRKQNIGWWRLDNGAVNNVSISRIHHDKRVNEYTIGTMNKKWKKNQEHNCGDLWLDINPVSSDCLSKNNNRKVNKASRSQMLLRYSIASSWYDFFIKLAIQTKRIAVTSLTTFDTRRPTQVNLQSPWIPRQTADFDHVRITTWHALLDPLSVLVCNEFYPAWVLRCFIPPSYSYCLPL